MNNLQTVKVWSARMRIGWLDGYEHNHTVYMEVTNTRYRVQGTKTMARLYNLHALNRIASVNELITSWRAPPAATSASASLLPSGFVEEDDIISSSGYLMDASPPISCIVISSSPNEIHFEDLYVCS
jgi:hypothetical protein